MTQTLIEGIEAPPRPSITDAMVLEAAVKVLKSAGCAEDPEDVVAAYRHGMDGYELAKQLDDHFSWDVDAALVEALDGVHSAVREVHFAACKAWAEEYKIQPPLANGTSIDRGVIHGVCQYAPASYLVKQYGCTQDGRFLIVKFEDAKARSDQ